MSTTIEFNNQLMPQSVVEIDELGDFGLEAINDEGYYYYIAVRCFQGMAVIATCGPVIPDVDLLPSGFSMSLSKTPFREDKMNKFLNLFLNDKHRLLTEARLISFEEAIAQFRELKNYLINLSEDTF